MSTDLAGASRERSVQRYVTMLAAFGCVLLALAAVSFAFDVAVSPFRVLAGTALLFAALLAFQAINFEFEWRDHRLTVSLEEALVLVGLAYLPPGALLLALPAMSALVHFRRGRPAIKGLFNASQYVVSGAAAWGGFVLAEWLGVPRLLAATFAVPCYLAVSYVLLAGVLSQLEGERMFHVFRERLAIPALLLSILGVAGGVSIVALLSVHPLALLSLLPFAYLVKRNTVLASRADRELSVHRRLAGVSLDLVGTADLDAVAERVLDTCGSVLIAGQACIRLDGAREGEAPREWTRTFETGPAPGREPIRMALPMRGGARTGELVVWSRPGVATTSDAERALAGIIAGQAASAFLSARALQALDAAHVAALGQQESMARQEKLSMLGTLVAGVAHEIGNPVTYMRASLEFMEMEVGTLKAHPDAAVRASGDAMAADVTTCLKGATRLKELTESLKSVARQGPGGQKKTDLNDIARDVANVVRLGMPKNVKLEMALAATPLPVQGNPSELTQVVLNLVKNAAEAIGERPGWVRVTTRDFEGRRVIDVEDNGPGIPEEVQEKLFKVFFTTKDAGTGLGLNISQRIVREHRGDLRLASEPGRGTTFTVDLPAAPA